MKPGTRVLLDGSKPGTIVGEFNDYDGAGYDVDLDNGEKKWVQTWPSGSHRLIPITQEQNQ